MARLRKVGDTQGITDCAAPLKQLAQLREFGVKVTIVAAARNHAR